MCLQRELLGPRVAGERARLAPVHIAGELIKQKHQRQPRVDAGFPLAQTAIKRLFHQGAKTIADARVDVGTAAEPEFVALVRTPTTFQAIPEPEVEHVLSGGGSQGFHGGFNVKMGQALRLATTLTEYVEQVSAELPVIRTQGAQTTLHWSPT